MKPRQVLCGWSGRSISKLITRVFELSPTDNASLTRNIIAMHCLSHKMWKLHLPREIVFGRGAFAQLPELLGRHNWRRVFIVTDRGVVSAGQLEGVTDLLRAHGVEVQMFADVTPEPPFECVDTVVRAISEINGCDCVIGLGGGSVMDTAKVAAAAMGLGKTAREMVGIGHVGKRQTGLLLAPTTAGSGSEATFAAILTDPAKGLKVGVVDPCLLADLVVVDPALTDSQPAALAVATGIDAMVHAVEAFIAQVATPLAQGLAMEALRYLGRSLPAVCRAPVDTGARDDMALGSHLAGLAFANSSCCGVHALALPLGGRYHIPHGVVTGGLMAAVMRHNAPACSEAFAKLGAALSWDTRDAEEFCSKFDALANNVGVTAALRRARVPMGALPELAREAVGIRRLIEPNPRAITEADALRIYEEVLAEVDSTINKQK